LKEYEKEYEKEITKKLAAIRYTINPDNLKKENFDT
jgi:hypothetical protein